MTGYVTLLRAKAITSDGERWVEGYATTKEVDRVGDVVDPKGAKFTLPLPLLFQHDHSQPIGAVTEARITERGIRIRARLSVGVQRAEEVWQLIKDEALTAVSIGFLALKKSPLGNGGYLFESWDWTELSVVSVPAQPGARISVAKGLVMESDSLALVETPPAPREVPLRFPETPQNRELVRVVRTLPPEFQGKVCDLKSGCLNGTFHLRDEEGRLVAQIKRSDEPMYQPPAEPVPGRAEPHVHKRAPVDYEALGSKIASIRYVKGLTTGGVDVESIVQANFDRAERLAKMLGGADAAYVRALIGALALINSKSSLTRIKDLEQRIARIEEKGVVYRGLYNASEEYQRGDLVTFGGSIFHATKDTSGLAPIHGEPNKPADHPWQLAVKRGRDAAH